MHTMRIVLFVAVASLGSLAGTFSASAQVVEGEEHCVVNVASWDRLNVRDEPGAGGDIVTKHQYGDCGLIVTSDTQNGWVLIEDGHFEGWVNSKFISMVSPALYCVSGVDDDDTLNLRAYPSTVSRVITELDPHQCDIAFLPYAVGNWQKVRADGHEGWVNRKFVSGE
jgi:uncharacterized protein YgiM (DUF1202 family)